MIAEAHKRRRKLARSLQKPVGVFGLGGVGSYAAEALVRSGIGTVYIYDSDKVAKSNINRQLIALFSTVGMDKTKAEALRLKDINPDCNIIEKREFVTPESSIPFESFDFIIDAVDNVTAKIQLVMACQEAGTPIICSMGAGNKLDPTKFQVADIYKTSVDPLARVMRRELKKRHVKHLKVVYSTEEARKPVASPEQGMEMTETGHPVPGSVAFVPSVCGLIIGGEVVKDLTKEERERLEQN